MADIVLQESKAIFGTKAFQRMVDKIEDLQKWLGTMPRMGSFEEALKDEEGEYRFLVINKRFKLVYEVVDEDNVLIIAVWDFKQKPEKLRYFI